LGLHWNCSGFSAHSLMRRIPQIVLLLTLLCGFFVSAPAARASRTHKHVSAPASLSTKKKQKPAAHAAQRSSFRASSKVRRGAGRLRSAVLQRHGRSRRVEQADASDQAPATVENASIEMPRTAMPSPLRGSFESLARQNEKTEDDNLERILDDDDLNDRIARRMLTPLPASAHLTVNGNLPENRRYCRPWTAQFLNDLAHDHAAEFNRPLVVSSAVRTVDYQKRLMHTNGNAAQAEGDVASPHLTGAAVDIAKQGLNRKEMAWMRAHLLALQEAGKIDVEEEFRQACFHITVYKSYAPQGSESDATAPTKAQPKEVPPTKPGKQPPATESTSPGA